MADNFVIKKTNYLSIWITMLLGQGFFSNGFVSTEGSICHYVMTHNVHLNYGLLKQVFTTGKRANQADISGFKF